MKKLFFASACILLLATSCKKSTPAPAPVASVDFITLTAGTTWNYQTTDNTTSTVTPYVLTATATDTTISSKTYRIFTSVDATGTTEAYYNHTGNDYYEYTQLSAQLPPIDLKYLNDVAAVGTTWSQPLSVTVTQFGITVTINGNISNSILSKGTTETVNNKAYSNVIKVKTEITNLSSSNPLVTPSVVSQNIVAYYAPKYGLIRRDFALHVTAAGTDVINTNTTNILLSSSIQ